MTGSTGVKAHTQETREKSDAAYSHRIFGGGKQVRGKSMHTWGQKGASGREGDKNHLRKSEKEGIGMTHNKKKETQNMDAGYIEHTTRRD